MTPQQQIEAFATDLHKLINRYRSECDLTLASAIGTLEVVKLELFHHQASVGHAASVKSPEGWMSMDSAPKDGTVFLAYQYHDAGGFQFLCTCNTDEGWVCMMSGDVMYPTHWRPSLSNP